jgi:hypothetical protein
MPSPTTTNRAYPQPHGDNTLAEDVTRIAQSIQMIDTDITAQDQQHQSQASDVNKKLHHIRLNTLLNENLFVI